MKNSSKLVRKNSFEVHKSHNRYQQFMEELYDGLELTPDVRQQSMAKHSIAPEYREIPEVFSIRIRKIIEKTKDTILKIFSDMAMHAHLVNFLRSIKEQYRKQIADICQIIRTVEFEEIFHQATLAMSHFNRLRKVFDPAVEQNVDCYQLVVKLQIQVEQLLLPLMIAKEFNNQKSSWVNDPMELIAQIQNDFAKKTFQGVVKQYLDEEYQRLGEEICRICEESIRIEQVEEHIRNCQKKHETIQGLKQCEKEILHLIDELKQKIMHGQNNNSEEVIQLFTKVIDNQKVNFSLMESRYFDIFERFVNNATEKKDDLLSRLKIVTTRALKEFLEQTQSKCSQSFSPSTPRINILPPQQPSLMRRKSYHFENNLISKLALEYIDSQEKLSVQSGDSSAQEQTPKARHDRLIPLSNITNSERKRRNSYDDDAEKQSQQLCNSMRSINIQKNWIGFKDFKVIKLLGKGAFGKVFLVKRCLTKDLYAMKMIELSSEDNKQMLHDLITEHQIFKKIGGEHLVKAAFSFSEGSVHFFFLEYMRGGDFAKLLEEEVYLSEQVATQYIAEIVLAIDHLHSFGIIHRDLKPSNIVLDGNGHIKLTDFGLSLDRAQQIEEGENRIIGTPDYIAPEVLKTGHTTNKSLDWWSLGVMLYEMLIGEKPFGGQTVEQVYKNILEGKIEWPEIGQGEGMITPQAKSLIEQLLQAEPIKRLGENGTSEIKQHPFFRKINWDTVKNEEIKFKPNCCKPQKFEQNSQLTQMIENAMKKTVFSSKLHILDDLVRFDILSEETIKSVEKGKRRNSSRLSQIHHLSKTVEKHFA